MGGQAWSQERTGDSGEVRVMVRSRGGRRRDTGKGTKVAGGWLTPHFMAHIHEYLEVINLMHG